MRTPEINATIYGKPGCMHCRATRHAIEKMGIPHTLQPIDTSPHALTIMREHRWTALPLVEAHIRQETLYWVGMSQTNLDYLAKAARNALHAPHTL